MMRVFHRRRSRTSGFTLLEVVIALGVFVTAAFSLVVALYTAFDAASARNQVEAAMQGLANQAALLHSAPLLTGERDLPPDPNGIGYHVSIEPEQMHDQKGQPVPNMYRVIITASWTEQGAAQQRAYSELYYQP